MLTVEKIIGDLHLTEMKIDSKSGEYLIIFLCGEEATKNIKIIYRISQGGREGYILYMYDIGLLLCRTILIN